MFSIDINVPHVSDSVLSFSLSRSSYSGAMHMFVKVSATKTITLEVSPRDTIGNVKAKIQEREGISIDMQMLLHAGYDLNDGRATLSSCYIQNVATSN